MFSCSRVTKEKESEKERWFLENGGRLLEELIKSCGRNYYPIRTFSKTELQEATNNYDRVHMEGNYKLYEGKYEDRSIFVKKFNTNKGIHNVESCINEVVVASQMKNHKNFLKLLGCCLETQVPELVYEFAENGNLYDHIHKKKDSENNPPILSWERKLRIATEIADAVSYLHTAVSRPIIHRDIKPQNIFLDEQFSVKLFDFSLSVYIPLGELYVEAPLCGTYTYMDSRMLATGQVTEKSDVYSFGIVLLEILTETRGYQALGEFQSHKSDRSKRYSMSDGRSSSVEEHCVQSWQMFIQQYLKANMLDEGNKEQLMACAVLAMKCLEEENPEDRPTMKSVAQELRRIKKIEPTSS